MTYFKDNEIFHNVLNILTNILFLRLNLEIINYIFLMKNVYYNRCDWNFDKKMYAFNFEFVIIIFLNEKWIIYCPVIEHGTRRE